MRPPLAVDPFNGRRPKEHGHGAQHGNNAHTHERTDVIENVVLSVGDVKGSSQVREITNSDRLRHANGVVPHAIISAIAAGGDYAATGSPSNGRERRIKSYVDP